MINFLTIMVISLSLVGSFSNSYAEINFITIFDGRGNGGIEFELPYGVAVDNNNRIIVSDTHFNLVQIYDSNGAFITSFNGTNDNEIRFPYSIATDSSNRIFVVGLFHPIIQIFDSNGAFIDSFDGSDGDGIEFIKLRGIAVDNNNRIIVSDIDLDLVQIYESNGKFITSFNGSDGFEFTDPYGIAVDNNNRIIVSDIDLGKVQIFESDGTFVKSFDGSVGGDKFLLPYKIAVDNNNRILVADTILRTVQIFDSDGRFVKSFDSSNGGTPFAVLGGVAVDNNDRIIVADTYENTVQIFEDVDTIITVGQLDDKKNGNGCSGDCTPPTIGLDEDNRRLVDNGFSYNGNLIQVERWHTPYPLITAIVNQTNTVEIIAYDNGGIFNLDMIQFGLGLEELGQALHDVEVLIEVHLDPLYSENTVIVEKVVIRDRDNLIDTYSVFAVTDVVQCIDDEIDEECLKVTIQYSYREATINNMMVVNVVDNSRNSQNFYLNDGVEVIGESMNPTPTYKIFNQKSNQQTENLWLNLVRTDKVNHIWMDQNGIEYLQVSESRFDRITPLAPQTCNDPPLDEVKVPTRKNCNFRALTVIWDK